MNAQAAKGMSKCSMTSLESSEKASRKSNSKLSPNLKTNSMIVTFKYFYNSKLMLRSSNETKL